MPPPLQLFRPSMQLDDYDTLRVAMNGDVLPTVPASGSVRSAAEHAAR